MFNPLNISAEELLRESRKLEEKLAAGLKTLPQLAEATVHYGATRKEEVWRDGKVVLYRFVGEKKPTRKTPLLIVYALVNRPYMVDLQADRSLVRGLLERGQDVYLLDWGYPDRSDRFLEIGDYLHRFIDGAVEHLKSAHGVDAPNILGICQGGAFSLCYAALRPWQVRNLITMVTPVDFHTPDNMLGNWCRELDVDLFVDTLGNVPAELMNASYLMLKPFRLNLQKYVGLIDILDDGQALQDFLRMEKWIFDSPNLAGEAFRQFIKDFYQKNALVKGGLKIDGEAVDLGLVSMPVLNIYAEQDHLVPPAASKALKDLVGTRDYTELSFRGGHIGIYVSSRAQREVPAAIDQWLAQRSR